MNYNTPLLVVLKCSTKQFFARHTAYKTISRTVSKIIIKNPCHRLFWGWIAHHPCRCSVDKSRPALCDRVESSTLGSPVLHYLPESAQTSVHWVRDASKPSHPLLPLPLVPSTFPSIRVFSSELALRIGWLHEITSKYLTLFLPMRLF